MKARLNIPLLLQVREKVTSDPKSLEMDYWVRDTEECGTVGCIAGWAVMLRWPDKDEAEMQAPSIPDAARMALLFPDSTPFCASVEFPEGLKSGNLFFVSAWPKEMHNEFIMATMAVPDYKAIKARVAGDRILRFIEDWKKSGWPYIDEEGKEVSESCNAK